MLGFNEKRGKKIIPGRETEKKSDTERGGKKPMQSSNEEHRVHTSASQQEEINLNNLLQDKLLFYLCI